VPGGVVRDPAVHRAVLERALATARSAGLVPLDVARSALLGPAGNREFFVHLGLPGASAPDGALAEERPDLSARVAECTAA
jgi:23S rRNA (cytidine1920-2'-O)/16S rRNA (cytidine1409-2'-O)-methyltransferase